jgi:hypothetical protein
MTGRGGSQTPTGRELHAMLQDGIQRINMLEDRPLSQPVPIIEETVVPMDVLLYRGPAALARAREVRDEIRRRGGPTPDLLGELYDLLDLAVAE